MWIAGLCVWDMRGRWPLVSPSGAVFLATWGAGFVSLPGLSGRFPDDLYYVFDAANSNLPK